MLALLGSTLALSAQGLAIRVDGEGYLRLVHAGRVAFARSANLSIVDGAVRLENGDTFLPNLAAPTGASALKVDLQGNVTATISGRGVSLGRLVLAIFPKGEVMTPSGTVCFAQDRPKLVDPGDDTNGVIRCGGDAPVQTAAMASHPMSVGPSKVANPQPQNLPSGKVAEISISASSECSSANFTLKDIATVTASPDTTAMLEQVVIGKTPVMGVARMLDIDQVCTSLRAAKLRPEDYMILVPTGAEVTRTGQTVTADQQLQAALAAAASQFGDSVKFDLRDGAVDVKVEPGAVTIRPEGCSKNAQGVAVVLEIDVDGRHSTSRVIDLTPRGGSLGVRSGQIVKVTLRSGGATVVVSGTAQSDGWIGQQIMVLTGDSGGHRTSLAGTVTGAGAVEVKV